MDARVGAHSLLPVAIMMSLVAAAPEAAAGTEGHPELTDSEDDVQYDVLYTGPRDRDYLDIVAAWFSFDRQDDRINLTFKFKDFSRFVEGTDWSRSIFFNTSVTVGAEEVGGLEFSVTRNQNTTTLASDVVWMRGQAVESYRSINHSFHVDPNDPARWIAFTIPRTDLLDLGEGCAGLYGWASEFYDPGGIPTIISNRDLAGSNASYNFASARPRASGYLSADMDDDRTGQGGNGTRPLEGDATPLPAPMALAAVAAAALLAAHRGHKSGNFTRPEAP